MQDPVVQPEVPTAPPVEQPVAPVEAPPVEAAPVEVTGTEDRSILDKILNRNQGATPTEEAQPTPPAQWVPGVCPVESCTNFGKKLVDNKCEVCGYDESARVAF